MLAPPTRRRKLTTYGKTKAVRKEVTTWDVPSSDEEVKSIQPVRKRQRTPARITPPAAPAVGPTRIQKPLRSPVALKRKIRTSSSEPASLFSMIRQPESPPTDSSENTIPSPPNRHSGKDNSLPSTPPPQVTASPASTLRNGSATPRQKELWGKLLGSDPIDGPSDLPPISKLHLHSTKARRVPSLSRSSSDVPQSKYSKRVRLIDSLKASAPIEEEDEDMEDIFEADEETESVESPPSAPKAVAVKQFARVNTIKRTTRVTYAQQRGYMEPKNEEAAFDQLMEELSQPTESQSSHFQSQDVDEDDSQQSMARGFHDLRAAGSNLRLSDMFDNLINEIEGTSFSVSIRRNALMELATKFFDQTATTYFLDRGFDRRLVKALSNITDVPSHFIAAAAVALLIDAGASMSALQTIHQSPWYSKLAGLLENDMDISRVIKERRNNMSKIAQISVVDFRDILINSKMWIGTTPKPFSPRLMALKCLELLVRKTREHGSQAALLDETTLESLLAVLESREEDELTDTTAASLALSILESSTTTPATQKKPSGWPTKLVRTFAELLPALIATSKSAGLHRRGDLALRLTLNLTNENPRSCDVFGSAETIQPLIRSIIENFDRLASEINPEERAMVLDRLTLSLGAMINLAEFSDKVRMAVIDGNDLLLNRAVELFLAGRERTGEADSIEAMQTNVPYGYLAILMGNLCQNGRVRKRVQRKLPQATLSPLINAVDEFTKIHQIADRDMFEGDEGMEVYSNFTARLQVVADNLRMVAATV